MKYIKTPTERKTYHIEKKLKALKIRQAIPMSKAKQSNNNDLRRSKK